MEGITLGTMSDSHHRYFARNRSMRHRSRSDKLSFVWLERSSPHLHAAVSYLLVLAVLSILLFR